MATGRFLLLLLAGAAATTQNVAVSGDASVRESSESSHGLQESLAATHSRHMRSERQHQHRQQLAVDAASTNVDCERGRWLAYEKYPQMWMPCCGAEEQYVREWQRGFAEAGLQFSHVVDVGANVGKYTKGLMRNPNLQNANYYLLEANPGLVKRLEKEFSVHQNVHIVAKAADEMSGNVAFYDTVDDNHDKTNGAIGQVDDHPMKFLGNLPSISMDEFAQRTPGLTSMQGLFVKIDVEGHDLKVLRGMRTLMKNQNVDAIQVEYNPRKWCKWQESEGLVKSAQGCLEAEVKAPATSLFKSFINFFDELGYEAFLIGPHYLKLTGMQDFKYPMVHAAGTGDIFAVQKDRHWAKTMIRRLTTC